MPTAKEKRRRVDTHEKRDETVSAHLECYTQESSCLINSYSPAKGFASELRQIFGTSLLTPQRGIHPAEIPDLSHARFIPTCVGNTREDIQERVFSPVHPHVRGEYGMGHCAVVRRHGSSPRAWGIPVETAQSIKSQRFIPTCVGNTSKESRKCGMPPVHPHVRGEYVWFLKMVIRCNGSSPRAWGIRLRPDELKAKLRFIPTCVGNTANQGIAHTAKAVHPHVRGEY